MTSQVSQAWGEATTPSQAYAQRTDAGDEATPQGSENDSLNEEIIIEEAGGSVVLR